MRTKYYPLYKPFLKYDEIIVEKELEHIYGFKNGKAVEIEEPHSPWYDSALALIQEMVFLSEGWKRIHKSEFEERYSRVWH